MCENSQETHGMHITAANASGCPPNVALFLYEGMLLLQFNIKELMPKSFRHWLQCQPMLIMQTVSQYVSTALKACFSHLCMHDLLLPDGVTVSYKVHMLTPAMLRSIVFLLFLRYDAHAI
jgi:hypothetical protein